MNTKDENAAVGSFFSAANTTKWPSCPYGSPWFVISQLNYGLKVLRCLFRKAPGLQHGMHVGVCLGEVEYDQSSSKELLEVIVLLAGLQRIKGLADLQER